MTEIHNAEDLQNLKTYFSRSSNSIFTVIKSVKLAQEVQFGENGKLVTMNIGKFQKLYMKNGAVEN